MNYNQHRQIKEGGYRGQAVVNSALDDRIVALKAEYKKREKAAYSKLDAWEADKTIRHTWSERQKLVAEAKAAAAAVDVWYNEEFKKI